MINYERKNIIIKWLVTITISLNASIIFPSCSYFAAGSYPFVEKYLIDTTEDAVIKAVNNFKTQHHSFVAPDYLEDGRRDSSDYWYHIYFYLPEEKIIVNCWTRPKSKQETAFAFVGINEGTGLGNWKDINKDFSSSENKKLLEIFERRLLKPIKLTLKKQNSL